MSVTLTIELPDALAARARRAAGKRPLPEAVVEWVEQATSSAPPHDWTDDAVLAEANARMADEDQEELATLLAGQREGTLLAEQRGRLERLMTTYRTGLVAKARATNEAVARGLLPGIGDGT